MHKTTILSLLGFCTLIILSAEATYLVAAGKVTMAEIAPLLTGGGIGSIIVGAALMRSPLDAGGRK